MSCALVSVPIVEKVDSPIGDENLFMFLHDIILLIVEKVDSPIGDENCFIFMYTSYFLPCRESRFPDRGRKHSPAEMRASFLA